MIVRSLRDSPDGGKKLALPGVKTILRDGFGGLSRTDIPLGTLVVALARRSNAEGVAVPGGGTTPRDYDPYFVRGSNDVITAFGENSEAHRVYQELLAGGAARIAIVPLPADVEDADLTSTAAGNPFDTAFDAAESAQPDIIVPFGRGGHPSEWMAGRAVTVDSTANTFTTVLDHGYAAGDGVIFDATTAPAGLTEGTTYYVVSPTSTTFQVADAPGGTPVDMTTAGDGVLVASAPPRIGFVADNSAGTTTSLAKRVSQKCKDLTDRSNPVFAVMGVTPYQYGEGVTAPTNGSMTPAEVSTHTGFATLIDRDDETTMHEHGGYVSVVGAEMKLNGMPDAWGFSNGAAPYAGFLSGLESQISSTGRTAFNVVDLRYVPTRSQQEAMVAAGVVPVGQNYRQVATWVDGLTFARGTSDFTRLTTLRIVFDAMGLVRQTAARFVGQPATLHHRNALETAVTSALNGMIKSGALLRADFVISYIPRENKALIDLVLTPAFEMRNIEVTVSVQL